MSTIEIASHIDNFMAANVGIEQANPDDREFHYRKCAHDRETHAHEALKLMESIIADGRFVFRDFYISRMFIDYDGDPCVYLGIGCSRIYEDEELIAGERSFGTIPVLKFLGPRVLYLGLYKGEQSLHETSPEGFLLGQNGEEPIFKKWA